MWFLKSKCCDGGSEKAADWYHGTWWGLHTSVSGHDFRRSFWYVILEIAVRATHVCPFTVKMDVWQISVSYIKPWIPMIYDTAWDYLFTLCALHCNYLLFTSKKTPLPWGQGVDCLLIRQPCNPDFPGPTALRPTLTSSLLLSSCLFMLSYYIYTTRCINCQVILHLMVRYYVFYSYIAVCYWLLTAYRCKRMSQKPYHKSSVDEKLKYLNPVSWILISEFCLLNPEPLNCEQCIFFRSVL